MPLISGVHEKALHKMGHDRIPHLQSNSDPKHWGWKEANSPAEEPEIPAPSLFQFDEPVVGESSDSTIAKFRLPSVAECAAHLELLEAFYVIHQQILVSTEIDTAMELKPNRERKTGHKGDTKDLKDPKWWETRQIKWDRYLEFATLRFLAWRDLLSFSDVTKTPQGSLSLKQLPPLDVLMVWHSFLLNPRLMAEHDKNRLLYRIRLPWKSIHAAIDRSDWSFHLSPEDAARFEKATGWKHDLFNTFTRWKPHKIPGWNSILGVQTSTSWEIGLANFGFGKTVLVQLHDRPVINESHEYAKSYIQLFKSTSGKLPVALKEAVIRQSSFVDKMNGHLWIRSPCVEGTIRRAIGRYNNFLTLLAKHEKLTVVPTLDIDLVWHTNQCFSGQGYAAGMKTRVGRFINHDDTIAKPALGDGFGETRKLYRIHFGKEYRICGCWDCEALLTMVEDAPADAGQEYFQIIAKKVQNECLFFRLVEIRRRKKLPLPAKAAA